LCHNLKSNLYEIAPNTPAPNKVIAMLEIKLGRMRNNTALQTERQGTQLNGLKLSFQD
jgi:hypothetical protein